MHHLARLAPLAACFALVSACSSAPADAIGSTADAVTSPTSTFLVPADDAVRVACRATWTTRFCTDAEARAAGDACVDALVASGNAPACARSSAGCFRVQTTGEACVASAPAYPDAASCAAPRARNCAFYAACVEATSPCGEGGYPLGYGEKYCTRYLLDDRFSPAGVAWRDHVMQCLQEALVPLVSETPVACDTILGDAFDSHPRCYTNGPSICFLPPSDIANVVGIIDGKDLLSLRSAKQMASVAATCVGQIARALFGGEMARTALPQELREETALRDQMALWEGVRARAAATAE